MSAALLEVAKLMERRAVESDNSFEFEVSQLLIDITATHEESTTDCPVEHVGIETGENYPCPDYARAVQITLSWAQQNLEHQPAVVAAPAAPPPRSLTVVPAPQSQSARRAATKALLDYQDGFTRAWQTTGEEMPHNWRAHVRMLHDNEVLLGDLCDAIDAVGAMCCTACRFARVAETAVADLGDLAKFDLPGNSGGDAG